MTEPDNSVTATLGLWRVLYHDINWNSAEEPADTSGAGRRALVRSVFAAIEGTITRLKDSTLDLAPMKLGLFTSGELALLREEDYELTQEGTVHILTARLGLLPNLRFTLAMLQRAASSKAPIDYGGQGWQQLRTSVKVRDRLMHPKKPGDLEVTGDEIKALKGAWEWFRKHVSLLLDDAKTYLSSVRPRQV